MTDMQDLVHRQTTLQQEANEVRAGLDLDKLLRTAGEPVLVGSAALGLMVWEDLDLTVVCDALDVERVLAIGVRLASHPDVHALTFRNDTGRWNAAPERYPDGLYLGVRYQHDRGAAWRLDLWFVDAPERQPDLRHVQTLPPLRIGPLHWWKLTDLSSSALARVSRRPDARTAASARLL